MSAIISEAKPILFLPSTFQIGQPVFVMGTICGVVFREGQVNYEVAVGTTYELGSAPVNTVRSYDVISRSPESAAPPALALAMGG